MFFSPGLIVAFAAYVAAAPAALKRGVTPAAGSTIQLIGQEFYDEWSSFASGVKTPAGVSVYGNIYDGALDSASQDLMSKYSGGIVEVGMSWKDDMTNHGYTQYQGAQLCNDIAGGKYDDSLTKLAQYLAGFSQNQYILRVDYEVSGNLHANTNPTTFDPTTFDLKAYPAAFAHVRQVMSGVSSDIQFMYHAVRGEASLLYPGDDVVDFQGFSIFNNDVCLPVGSTSNCDGQELDPNVIVDIKFATKPKWVAESAAQPPAVSSAADFQTYLERITAMIETYDFAGWTYINSDWNAHGWPTDTWGDSRIETNAPILSWYNTNVAGNSRYVFGS